MIPRLCCGFFIFSPQTHPADINFWLILSCRVHQFSSVLSTLEWQHFCYSHWPSLQSGAVILVVGQPFHCGDWHSSSKVVYLGPGTIILFCRGCHSSPTALIPTPGLSHWVWLFIVPAQLFYSGGASFLSRGCHSWHNSLSCPGDDIPLCVVISKQSIWF